jgi:hypothetical protein
VKNSHPLEHDAARVRAGPTIHAVSDSLRKVSFHPPYSQSKGNRNMGALPDRKYRVGWCKSRASRSVYDSSVAKGEGRSKKWRKIEEMEEFQKTQEEMALDTVIPPIVNEQRGNHADD